MIIYREISIVLDSIHGWPLVCAVTKAYTWRHGTLRCALTQPYASKSCIFTVTDCGRRVRRCSFSFPCVLNDVYKCKLYNGSSINIF